MSKHRDHGAMGPLGYIDNVGNLWRSQYAPYGRVLRAGYDLDHRAVCHGELFGNED